ncbi:hypothetical protein GCM10010124_26500 [Pilimelia terevasa]|uniref:HTH gntR-type domain-containing protein n=1 Tax=Pilimelia terevasa TaxID=53372 RepID=A0A8J3BNS2_9ACTN|nr:GntR family transcriptional regulator [Pilimelia terevasa]GGK32425.1 hypothetical protein GCM10010124_26500 [Pilimelia terevasa]
MTPERSGLTRSDSLHRQVARTLRNHIEAGTLRDGDVLPSTRELAEQWGVSVFTISEAMKLLIAEGLVVTKSRSKRIVNSNHTAAQEKVRLRNPLVIMVGGFAGSGKTELGRILARETGWPILDKDTLTRPVVEAALEVLGLSPNDRESEAYLSVIRPREYEALAAATLENVSCGNSAIVTAPFLREFGDTAWLARTQATFSTHNASTHFVWMHCDPDTMHTYIRHRGAARDAAKLADWPGYLASIDTDFRPAIRHDVIDNCSSGVPLQTQAKNLLSNVLDGAL